MTGKLGPRGPRIPVIWGPGGPSLGGPHFTLTPALLWLSSHVLLPRVLAEVESRSPTTTTVRRVGKGLGILLHYAKESNERNTKPKLKDRGAYAF